MAIAGSWAAGNVTPSEYAGSTRWGTGINPIHAIRAEGPGRGPIKEPLGSVAPSGAVDPSLTGVPAYGFTTDDPFYGGEDYRYLDNDHPNWGDGTQGRADRGPGITSPDGMEPDPGGFPSWGPHGARGHVFPQAEWPGGSNLRAQSEGTDVENSRAIAVPSRGWSGGWLNKAHGEVSGQADSDPSQLLVTTSEVQLHQTRVNTAATVRATDDPRAPIRTRLTGQKVKHYAMSSGMGGGPGTPDMAPVTQQLPFRPWFYRSAGTPPPPSTMYGTMTGNDPLERIPPADAGELVTTTETGQQIAMAGAADMDYYA